MGSGSGKVDKPAPEKKAEVPEKKPSKSRPPEIQVRPAEKNREPSSSPEASPSNAVVSPNGTGVFARGTFVDANDPMFCCVICQQPMCEPIVKFCAKRLAHDGCPHLAHHKCA